MRRSLALLGSLLGSLLAVAPTVPVHAADPPEVVAVGDSVMLGARWELERRDVDVDAVKSRSARVGIDIPGRPDDVVIHLGTNGPMTLRECRRLVGSAPKGARVHLVTLAAPRRWIAGNNMVLRACAQAAGRDRFVRLIDWEAAVREHPGWVYSDGIHLRPEGAKGYARLLLSSVRQARAATRG